MRAGRAAWHNGRNRTCARMSGDAARRANPIGMPPMFPRRAFLRLALAVAAAVPLHACLHPALAHAQPSHTYLTWRGDTATTMVVHFHTAAAVESVVRYDTASHADGGEYAHRATGASHQIPGLEDGRHVHTVELTGLAPGTTYHFRVPDGEERMFRTLPNDGSPIRAIFGGDVHVLPLSQLVLTQAAKQNPDVAVIGGDIAYANGELKNIRMWDLWLRRWESTMVREDGALIPAIHAIGNHEVNKTGDPDPTVRAPFFFGFFDQGGKTHFARDLGPHAHLVVLDTGHITPHAEQVDFLKDALAAADARPFVFASYHVPQYPSHRSYDDSRSQAARELWAPLFDAHRLSIGFEHHDHTFKRTKPIRGGKVDDAGTVYLGDGAMGVPVREIKNGDAWYIEKASSDAHIWVADITAEKTHLRAINQLGEQIDEVTVAPRTAAP